MGDKRKKRVAGAPKTDPVARIFAELNLQPSDFEIRSGQGKSFLSGQRLIWMEVTERKTGRRHSGKSGTSKKATDIQTQKLLRQLLSEFRR